MAAIYKKPTRRQLLMGITRLQNLVGMALAHHQNCLLYTSPSPRD